MSGMDESIQPYRIELGEPERLFAEAIATHPCGLEGLGAQMGALLSMIRLLPRNGFPGSSGEEAAGLSLYRESEASADERLESDLVAQALRSLAESSEKLQRGFRYDTRFLREEMPKRAIAKIWPRTRAHDISECILSQAPGELEGLHLTTLLRAAIYCERGEMLAAERVLEEHSRFLKEDVAESARLFEKASHLIGMNGGEVWKSLGDLASEVEISNGPSA